MRFSSEKIFCDASRRSRFKQTVSLRRLRGNRWSFGTNIVKIPPPAFFGDFFTTNTLAADFSDSQSRAVRRRPTAADCNSPEGSRSPPPSANSRLPPECLKIYVTFCAAKRLHRKKENAVRRTARAAASAPRRPAIRTAHSRGLSAGCGPNERRYSAFCRPSRPMGIIPTFLLIFAIIIEFDTLRKVRKLQIADGEIRSRRFAATAKGPRRR